MPVQSNNYKLFFSFIEKYASVGFIGIDPDDPLMVELEKMMKINDQFFYIADIIELRVIYTSRGSVQMIGVQPADITPYSFMSVVHPDDAQRLSVGRSKIVKLAQDIFIAKQNIVLLSTNYRFLNAGGKYSNFLVQCYLFYSRIPHSTVYLLKIHTNVDWCKKLKNGYHYYVGTDLAFFRYPDEELLLKGNIFTDREFEIIKMIESGFSSEQIAEKLFLSRHTVNTHRRNILAKAGKTKISELIHDLILRGML
jgi:DNA-binding CsgD family transcriptional regulator